MDDIGEALIPAPARKRVRSVECRLMLWRQLAHAAFILSLLFFLGGSAISLLTYLAVLDAGVFEASLTVSSLLLSLACSFGGAHALDRIDEIVRKL